MMMSIKTLLISKRRRFQALSLLALFLMLALLCVAIFYPSCLDSVVHRSSSTGLWKDYTRTEQLDNILWYFRLRSQPSLMYQIKDSIEIYTGSENRPAIGHKR